MLASIIGPRVEEILELALNELRRSGFPEDVLTSGVVLTGGASLLNGCTDLAENVFNLPARVGVPQEISGVSERIRNPRYATVIGLLQTAQERALHHGSSAGVPVRRRDSEAPADHTPAPQRSHAVHEEDDGESWLTRAKQWINEKF